MSQASPHATLAAMVEDAYHQVKRAYPPGCLHWLKGWDPDRVTILKKTVKEAKRAYVKRDTPGLSAALANYRDSHLETFEEYRAIHDEDDDL